REIDRPLHRFGRERGKELRRERIERVRLRLRETAARLHVLLPHLLRLVQTIAQPRILLPRRSEELIAIVEAHGAAFRFASSARNASAASRSSPSVATSSIRNTWRSSARIFSSNARSTSGVNSASSPASFVMYSKPTRLEASQPSR